MADTAEDVQEPGIDPQMNDLAGWLWRGIYYTFRSIGLVIYYIVYCVSFAVLFLLRLLWRPLEFILLPVFYLLQFIFNLLLAPFQFLAKFETLYIYLGIAALVGIGLGLLASFVFDSLRKPLGLDEASQPQQSESRTAKQYRKEKRKGKARAEAPLITAGYLSPGHLSLSEGSRRRRNKGLLSQTILEEGDSDS